MNDEEARRLNRTVQPRRRKKSNWRTRKAAKARWSSSETITHELGASGAHLQGRRLLAASQFVSSLRSRRTKKKTNKRQSSSQAKSNSSRNKKKKFLRRYDKTSKQCPRGNRIGFRFRTWTHQWHRQHPAEKIQHANRWRFPHERRERVSISIRSGSISKPFQANDRGMQLLSFSYEHCGIVSLDGWLLSTKNRSETVKLCLHDQVNHLIIVRLW